jgi:hypothetical protein
MATLDKAALLARSVANDDTEEVPIGNGVVIVRALTRGEVRAAKRAGKGDDESAEDHLIATALVDPKMTADEVGEWLEEAPAGDAVAIGEAVQRLSGLSEGAPKRNVAKARTRRRK